MYDTVLYGPRPNCTYGACCLVSSSRLDPLSRGLYLRSQFWLWQCRFPQALALSSILSCALKFETFKGARSFSLPLSVDFDAERELPGPSAFDFDFSLFHLPRSRTFPHELAGTLHLRFIDAVHDGVRLCNLAVDSCHPRLKRIYMRGCTRTRAHAFSATLSNKSKTHGGNTHTILDRAVPKLGGDDLEYFPLQPATFGHCCIGIPIRCDLA